MHNQTKTDFHNIFFPYNQVDFQKFTFPCVIFMDKHI